MPFYKMVLHFWGFPSLEKRNYLELTVESGYVTLKTCFKRRQEPINKRDPIICYTLYISQ